MRIAEKKKSQIAALYEQCSGLPADVRSCLENGYFTVTVPPPWNMSNQKVAQEVQDKIKEWLKVMRKANVAVVFATQSISDVVQFSWHP